MRFDITQEPRRASRTTSAYPAKRAAETPEVLPNHTRPQRGRWYAGCIMGALIILGLLFTLSRVVIPWYQGVMSHWQYGEANVYHVRADLGRGSVSDVYTIPTQGNVVVVIVTGSKIEMYPMRMQSTGYTLVIASVMDMNGDNRPDIILHVDGSDVSTILNNTGNSFQPTPPGR